MNDFPPGNRSGMNSLYGDQVSQQGMPYGGDQMPRPRTPYSPVDPYQSKATAVLVLGIVALTIWLIPFVGAFASIACSIIGIVMSSEGKKSPLYSSRATTGRILSIIAVVLVPVLLLCTMGGILII